ncbi:MAG: ATP-binding protein [Candidatus Nanohalarchaeota archaeon]|nr:MAG: ATP-binding protein [Candidatus Nanohaloarchaeota archaeon]
MDYIINRKEVEQIKKENAWLLVYGRRKIGKTFLLRQLCGFENYYLVKKNRDILSNGEKKLSLEEMLSNVKKSLCDGKTVVIDEFQRLDESDIEELTTIHPKGRLIISGSSFRITRKIFEPNSPLLGFFSPFKMDFINPVDIVKAIKKEFEPSRTIELSTFLREPWLIPLYNNEDIMHFVYNAITRSKYIISGLVGEIFNEEDRNFTSKYEALLNLIGSGTWNPGKMSSVLYSRELINEPGQSHIIQYLKNMKEMALVEKVKLLNSKKRHYWRLASPIAGIYYYMDDRYNIGERDISFEEAKPMLELLINLQIQDSIADYFADIYNGRKEYYISPEREIDFIITRRNKADIIGEVKWKKVVKSDIEKFKYNTRHFNAKKVFICKKGVIEDDDVEVVDAEKLLNSQLLKK